MTARTNATLMIMFSMMLTATQSAGRDESDMCVYEFTSPIADPLEALAEDTGRPEWLDNGRLTQLRDVTNNDVMLALGSANEAWRSSPALCGVLADTRSNITMHEQHHHRIIKCTFRYQDKESKKCYDPVRCWGTTVVTDECTDDESIQIRLPSLYPDKYEVPFRYPRCGLGELAMCENDAAAFAVGNLHYGDMMIGLQHEKENAGRRSHGRSYGSEWTRTTVSECKTRKLTLLNVERV